MLSLIHILQKTFIDGKRHQVQNRGEKAMYYAKDNHPPIVSEKIWEKAQRKLEDMKMCIRDRVQGVSISKWQYKNSSGNWVDYPTTSDNGSITGGTLAVSYTHLDTAGHYVG